MLIIYLSNLSIYNYIHKQRHDKNINTFQVLTNDDMTSDHVPIFIEII